MLASGLPSKLQVLRSRKVRDGSASQGSQTLTYSIVGTHYLVRTWTFLDLQRLLSFYFMAIIENVVFFGGNTVVDFCFLCVAAAVVLYTSDGPSCPKFEFFGFSNLRKKEFFG